MLQIAELGWGWGRARLFGVQVIFPQISDAKHSTRSCGSCRWVLLWHGLPSCDPVPSLGNWNIRSVICLWEVCSLCFDVIELDSSEIV